MLRPPPVPLPLRPPAPRASALPLPRAANPNTDPTTTTTTGTMGAAAWWRRTLGQRFNPAGVAAVVAVAASEPRLALPHVSVQDIRWLDWAELRRAGFRGVVFDKDNTLTAPYAPAIWSPLAAAFDQCRATFPPGALAIYSNSAGLKQYDPDGADAKAIEAAIEGVHVIRHGKNGFLTVFTEPLSFTGESYIVRRVRKLEAYIVNYWCKKGYKPVQHPLLPDARKIVKFDPYDNSTVSRS
ncbi:hypothetical protein PR202_gb04523 [Eleusine coracana subsp. coracana]|uniref:Uncharacterized protein n=1 Tax=Eleusine coracana subsp. coracana TaxID=191504 RepID=A0AAV5E2E0_ELECO|nr:hypothetical protein PR202_gb04523 [Eleusine coracana subsp. coracana]